MSIVLVTVQLGCSSNGTGEGGERTSVNQSRLSRSPKNVEQVREHGRSADSSTPQTDDIAEIQRVLDARYMPNDIRHSFETAFGETIDCIDYYSQPGVKQLRAAGRQSEIPDPIPRPPPTSALPDFMFNGKPDRHGSSRACPDGTVPMLRYTVDDVRRTGGVKGLGRFHRHEPPPNPVALPETVGHAHITQGLTSVGDITQTQSWMNILSPNVPYDPQSFSLSQTWTYTGVGVGYGPNPCTTDCFQTIESGWIVSPHQYANNNPQSPHFFTYATNDGYVTGCFNNVSTPSVACLPWISQNSSMTEGMTLPSSTLGGPQTEMQVVVEYLSSSAQWCLTVNGIAGMYGVSHIGCWPSSDFHGSMQTGATYFQVGGEIFSDLDYLDVPMGSGLSPMAGYGYAGYHRDYKAYLRSTSSWSQSFTPFTMLDRLSYGMATNVAAGGSWSNWFYFGNTPLIGWQTSLVLL